MKRGLSECGKSKEVFLGGGRRREGVIEFRAFKRSRQQDETTRRQNEWIVFFYKHFHFPYKLLLFRYNLYAFWIPRTVLDCYVLNFAQIPTFLICCLFLSSILSQDKATGNKAALWLRAKLQRELFLPLGRITQAHAGKVLLLGCVLLLVLCVGLKGAEVESKMDQIWVEGERCKVQLEPQDGTVCTVQYLQLNSRVYHKRKKIQKSGNFVMVP